MTKDSHPLDDFFRESLKDLKVAPSKNARGSFLEEAARIGGKNGAGFWRWFGIISVAILITTSAILFFYFRGSQQVSRLESPSPATSIQKQSILPVSRTTESVSDPVLSKKSLDITVVQPSAQINPESPKIKISKPISFQKSQIVSRPTVATSSPSKPHESDISFLKNEKNFPAESRQTNNVTESPAAEVVTGNDASANVVVINSPDLLANSATSSDQSAISDLAGSTSSTADYPNSISVDKSPETSKQAYNPIQSPWQFGAYLKYSFDWRFNKPEDKAVNSLGLEGVLTHGRFSLVLGGGISASKNQVTNQVLYNDFLGNYKKLDSITFAWDDKQYYLVPTFYMSDNKVWDSTIKSDQYMISKRYRIMNIPLMIGYDLVEQQKFHLSLRTGVAMSFCLDSRKLSGEYFAGQKRLITNKQEIDEYTRNRFYLLADIVATYALTRKFVLELDPHLDYLMNPHDSKNNSWGNLFIPGIKVSLKYKL
jgi:hypothetical protein